MAITFGSPDEKIKTASIDELIHALITPDGIACRKKALVLQEILDRPEVARQAVEKLVKV
jgi:hypothetical protein